MTNSGASPLRLTVQRIDALVISDIQDPGEVSPEQCTDFKPMMARIGIAEGKVPYSARHTCANKQKKQKVMVGIRQL